MHTSMSAVNKAVFDRSGTAHFCTYSKYPLDRGNIHLITEHCKSESHNNRYDIRGYVLQ
jgi:hypothetical protein